MRQQLARIRENDITKSGGDSTFIVGRNKEL